MAGYPKQAGEPVNVSLLRGSSLAAAVGFCVALWTGCTATVGGFSPGPSVGVDLGVDYYEPYGAYYGWGPGYRVGPYRGGSDYHGGGPAGHAYRSAPASRSMPSIPSRAGGGRGGHSR